MAPQNIQFPPWFNRWSFLRHPVAASLFPITASGRGRQSMRDRGRGRHSLRGDYGIIGQESRITKAPRVPSYKAWQYRHVAADSLQYDEKTPQCDEETPQHEQRRFYMDFLGLPSLDPACSTETIEINKRKPRGATVVVRVGSGFNRQDFHVDKALLCARSDFFRAALNGYWRESWENQVELPEQSAGVFQHYLQWLSGITLSMQLGSRIDNMAISSTLYRLVSFGDAIQDLDFVDVMGDTIKDFHALSKIEWNPVSIYQNTSKSSPLRTHCVDEIVRVHGMDYSDHEAYVERDFYKDVVSRYCEINNQFHLLHRSRSEPFYYPEDLYGKCRYHRHKGAGGDCYLRKGLGGFKFLTLNAATPQNSLMTSSALQP